MSGWTEVRLDECCDIVSGATPSTTIPEYWGGDICWATPKDLSELDGAVIADTPRKITEAGLASCAAEVLPAGSVLFSSRAPIGHVAINAVPMATNQGFKSFVPRQDHIEARFLYWWLKAHRSYMESLGNGATFKEVSKAVVSRVRIPLPPLSEQRRIAEVLDRAEALRATRHRALALLDDLTESVFFAQFGHHRQTPIEVGDRLDEHPCGWRWELLTDVARLATGHTPDRKRPNYWGGDIPWITLSDIRSLDGSVAWATSEMVTRAGIDNSSAVKLPAGTVCFSRTASVGFVTVMGREMATSQDFVNWVCGPPLDPTYLMHAFLRSRQRLRALSTGSTHKTIYFPTVERFRVLIPPLSLQREFAERVAMIEKAKDLHRVALRYQEDLFASLQHRAFRGEL